MAEQSGDKDDTLLSPKDMRLWLKVETRSARLAAARRIQEANDFVNDYVSGHLEPEDANRRLQEHEDKWGNGANDPLVGSEIRDHAFEEVLRRKQARQTGNNSKNRSP